VWGCSDFWGGVLSRRAPVLVVSMLSQAAGFVVLLAALPFVDISSVSFRFGLLAGVGGAVGLSLFYWALSIGTMSIVAPIAACSVLIPFSLALGRGERPSALALGGAALAILGVAAASLEERRSEVRERGKAIVIAVGSAIAIGVFMYFLGRGGQAGSAFSTLFGARIVSLGLLVGAVALAGASLHQSPSLLGQAALVGLGDVTANALFTLAADRGLLAIVSVLGSVYPVATVILAHVVLGERISRVQRTGILVAFVGVAAVSAG
jgi:drug/metabolite transporter (DMT)-like permease